MVNNWLAMVGGALFPNNCCLCQWRCPGQLPLCPECHAELTPNTAPCRRCALPLATGPGLCGQCLGRPPPFDGVIAPWLYDEYLAHLLWRWKFQGERALTPLLADLWRQLAGTVERPDAIVPIPLHWYRQWRRGYNQAELLAIELAGPHRLPVSSGLLRRRRATAAQSGMNATARSRNMRGAFTAGSGCENLRVALVDDVLTTGTTAREAAACLKAAGAARVDIWCLARTPAPGH